MLLEVGPRGFEVREGRLGRHEVQLHQPAGGVVDENQQRAVHITLLEPGVVAAVDLDQLADARPAIARLVDLGRALFAGCPQAGRRHQHPDDLLGQHKPVALTELLARKCWPEISIAFADQCRRTFGHLWRQPVIAWASALA
jgi:hypothetical protein